MSFKSELTIQVMRYTQVSFLFKHIRITWYTLVSNVAASALLCKLVVTENSIIDSALTRYRWQFIASVDLAGVIALVMCQFVFLQNITELIIEIRWNLVQLPVWHSC